MGHTRCDPDQRISHAGRMEDILLRRWADEDAAALAEIFTSAPDLAPQFAEPVRTVSDAREAIATRLRCTPADVNAAIVVQGRAVGNVALTDIRREGAHAGTAWVSYFSSAHVRGRGLVGRGCSTLCTWALTDLGLERLELGYRVNNPASGGVARRAGFVVEGLQRQKLVYDGVRYDVETCARLASDPVPMTESATIDLGGASTSR